MTAFPPSPCRLFFLAVIATVLVSFAPAQQEFIVPRQVTVFAEGSYVATDVATGTNGTLYVVDGDHGVIWKYPPGEPGVTLAPFFVVGRSERVPVSFVRLQSIAVDARSNVYVTADRGIYRVAPNGATQLLAGNLDDPRGIAVSIDGDIYIAEAGSHVIRKISRDGVVTTLAGKPGERGRTDGTASARFNLPTDVAVDASGMVFVADTHNGLVRRITPEGEVSTFGEPIRGVAPLDSPSGITIDPRGNLYVSEGTGYSYAGYRICRISPDGSFTRYSISGGYGDGVEAGGLTGIAFDPGGRLYGVDFWWGVVVAGPAPPNFTEPLAGQSAMPGDSVTFSANITGAEPIALQWHRDGVAIPGATSRALTLTDIQQADLGRYSLLASNTSGSVTSTPAPLTLVPPSDRLSRFSIYGQTASGAQSLIVGFVIGGGNASGATPLLIRGVGPSLGVHGIAGFLIDPALNLYSGTSLIASNDNWGSDPRLADLAQRVGTFPLAAPTSRDAALYREGLREGSFQVQVAGVEGTHGSAFVEIFDPTPQEPSSGGTPRLLNVSALAHLGRDGQRLPAHFTIGGVAHKTLLLRAVGPTLGQFGVAGALANPRLAVFRGATPLEANDDWGGHASLVSAAAAVGAFPLGDSTRDAALLVTLPPGSYTVYVNGAPHTSGIVLFEIYEVPGHTRASPP